MNATIVVAVRESDRVRFLPDDLLAELGSHGRVRVLDDPRSYGQALADADVLVTGWTSAPLTAEILDGAPRLGLVAHTGASVKFLVTARSWQRGVRVTQGGAAMAESVAETALTLTMVGLQRLHRTHAALARGAALQEARQVPERREIAGARIGVIGASRTGRAYITRVQALGAQVSVHDPYLSEPAAHELGVRRAELDRLLQESLVVSVHAPATAETEHMLGAVELAQLQEGAVLINTARSRVVEPGALLEVARSGRIEVALDVYDNEPDSVDAALRMLPNVVLSPHVAGNTRESRRRGGQILVDEIGRFVRGEDLLHEVTEEMLVISG
ncbi:hydroxyacid dehydrogenase [Ruania alkalisoli]|uniref:Hydroxyacid dehydrogenase n=1 Tax=Ruania alkalisoli TaxID=2779775 RepID=A0A7M1SS74_9MICO|nr:hydroxyacid dehydrogenase [Ruania alkalisoli]QOR70335.1 hydroxyacid dehydrogenase [Ruania alkalisoli]